MKSCDILIVGSGIVGMTVAHQLLELNSELSINIIDKEADVGLHTSGRNSGVLHAGVYYEPNTLKARICVDGSKRLRAWCKNEGLQVLECGKIITPQKASLDQQLDLLLARGKANGANVELIDSQQLKSLIPDAHTTSGRAIWSPDTCVIKPIQVLHRLKQNLLNKGVTFTFGHPVSRVYREKQNVIVNRNKINYGHLINCAGLNADKVAKDFGISEKYTMLPFRGTYWQLKKDAPLKINRNLYPVPDLNFPFLGVHFTPSVDGNIYLGPTAIPALGRENYYGIKGIDVETVTEFVRFFSQQLITNEKIRRYISYQAFQWVPNKFLEAARSIAPKLELKHIEPSKKVGIRPQLYDKKNRALIDDFLVINSRGSTHVVNAISPAFTASFSLADHIIDRANLF